MDYEEESKNFEEPINIAPLPELLLDVDEVPPKLEPPEGWKPPNSPPSENTPSGISAKSQASSSSFFPSEFITPGPEKFWNPFKLLDGKSSSFMPSALIDQPHLMNTKPNVKSAKPGSSNRTMEVCSLLKSLDPSPVPLCHGALIYYEDCTICRDVKLGSYL